MQKWGVSTFILLYSSVIITACEGKVRFSLLLFGSSIFQVSHARFFIILKPVSHPTLYYTKTWYELYISDPFLWSLQKMKSKWTIFFECPSKMFFSFEKVIEKISEEQP